MTGEAPVPVLTAVTGEPWEAPLVASLERAAAGMNLVRRCVDLADLLSAAAAGHGRVVLLSAELRRLDREALDRLASCQVGVVGVVAPGDEDAERRLRGLGVQRIVAADASPGAVVQAVESMVLGGVAAADREVSLAWADPAAAFGGIVADADLEPGDLTGPAHGDGRLVAVWGPTGAPGRTSMAVGVAAEAAALGVRTLLADADTYGGVVAQVLGLLEEAPGLAAAARSATAGRLDVPGLARYARQLTPELRVLTGLARAERWPELRPAALDVVWSLSRRLAELTVVDCGFCLEQDEEISFDTLAPRRNGATLATLAAADVVLLVGSADPVGLQRLIRATHEVRDVLPEVSLRVVVNRVRRSAVGTRGEEQIRELLSVHCGLDDAWLVPEDRVAFDAATARATVLGEVAPDSPARAQLARLAAHLAGRRARRGRWARRRMSIYD